MTKSISAGAALAFARTTAAATPANAFQVAPRLGYGMMVGPWLGVWPRAGVTYVGATNQSYLGLTIDLAAVIVVAPHFAITFAPVANIGALRHGKHGRQHQRQVHHARRRVRLGDSVLRAAAAPPRGVRPRAA